MACGSAFEFILDVFFMMSMKVMAIVLLRLFDVMGKGGFDRQDESFLQVSKRIFNSGETLEIVHWILNKTEAHTKGRRCTCAWKNGSICVCIGCGIKVGWHHEWRPFNKQMSDIYLNVTDVFLRFHSRALRKDGISCWMNIGSFLPLFSYSLNQSRYKSKNL